MNKNMLVLAYKSAGATTEEASKMASRHFVAVTDKNDKTSELRRTANAENWTGELFIHDDVRGRFSAFDDHVLFALAYAGMKKDDMVAMLNGAKDMTKFLAEQKAIYNAGKPLFVNPIKAFGQAIKSAKGGKAAAIAGTGILASYLWKTLLGSLDDLTGAAKDSIQDANNFGVGTSALINIPAAAVGILSTAFIVPRTSTTGRQASTTPL